MDRAYRIRERMRFKSDRCGIEMIYRDCQILLIMLSSNQTVAGLKSPLEGFVDVLDIRSNQTVAGLKFPERDR